MWSQAAVGIAKKNGHIVRCVIEHHQVWRSVAVDVSGFDVVADPKIFQNARTCLRSYRLEGAVAVYADGHAKWLHADKNAAGKAVPPHKGLDYDGDGTLSDDASAGTTGIYD